MNVDVMSAWQILFKGGPMMWPILLLSTIAMAIGINRLSVLANIERSLISERDIVLASLRQGHLKETLKLCEDSKGIVAGIMKVGILKFGASCDLVKAAMDEVLDDEVLRLKKHMEILSLIVNIAPLMGMLGTVNAMTVVFHKVVIRSNMLNPATAGDLGVGIWQALLATSAGLVVAILSLSIYSFCVMRINIVTVFIGRSTTEIREILEQLAESRRVNQEPDHER